MPQSQLLFLPLAAASGAADDVDGAAAAAAGGSDAISLTCTSSDRADIAHTPHCTQFKTLNAPSARPMKPKKKKEN